MIKKDLLNKIKGALYGAAIGDMMGATTEFMKEEEIKQKYGEITYPIGGGWLNLNPGEVTDDTQMSMCVLKSVSENISGIQKNMIRQICKEFINWKKSNPKDIGGTCNRVISNFEFFENQKLSKWSIDDWFNYAKDDTALGNGSLMRCLPTALFCNTSASIMQGMLTHNNSLCIASNILYDKLIKDILMQRYHKMSKNYDEFLDKAFNEIIKSNISFIVTDKKAKDGFLSKDIGKEILDPTGHVVNSLNNAIYFFNKTLSYRTCIKEIVNMGGDADTIACIAGGLSGCYYGYFDIPKSWIDVLDVDTRLEIDYYVFNIVEALDK